MKQSKNKVILLTGASGGIASAIISRLSSNDYKFIGIDKKESHSNEKFAEFIKLDLTDERELNKVCKGIKKRNHSIWSIIFCAGIYPIKSFDNYTDELWREVHDVNNTSIYQVVKGLYKKIENGGRVIIISSGAAHIGSRDIGYSSSKAATIGLMRSLSKILAPSNILVNAICPGVIQTPMSNKMSKEAKAQYLDKIPLKRIGLPEEVAVCVSFLLDEENSYMTGATIDVNGGLYSR